MMLNKKRVTYICVRTAGATAVYVVPIEVSSSDTAAGIIDSSVPS